MAEQYCPKCKHVYKIGDQVCHFCHYVFTPGIIFPTGAVLHQKYEVQQLIHTGGMGYVYLVKDKDLFDRLCIMKQIKETIESEEHKVKLEEEALRMSKLNHANIAMIFDHFIESGFCFLVEERIPGKTLNEIFKEYGGRLAEDEVVRWAISICSVTTYIHHEGILHRDISPDNIMLNEDGIIKFIDFGTMRELRYGAQAHTAGMGKYGYTPPEQWQGKPEAKSDIFAIGATIYYLLTGFLPLSESYRIQQSPQKEDFYPQFPPIRQKNPEVSPELEAILEKALKLDIQDRYVSAAEMQREFYRLIQPETVRVPEPPKPISPVNWQCISLSIQHPATLLPLAVCVLAIIYFFLLSPVFGSGWIAVTVLSLFVIATIISYVYQYKKIYLKKYETPLISAGEKKAVRER